ncbi:MAG: FHA domain-containing protein [Bacteriovorax sp.]|jgi:pSer/pThr/pTyr-binding forkhead associated (FHA) protein|nr:FHA domain-containing protein [Bacteriovorax sp.]
MAIVLLITTNDEQTIELPILGKCIIGRSSSCDLTLEDKEMSGKHGSFEISKQGQLLYTDLGSTNGSFLNEMKVQKTHLQIGHKLRLGNTHFIIDEKRLNSNEKSTIGKAPEAIAPLTPPSPKPIAKPESDELTSTRTKTVTETAAKTKSVVLSKDLKQKASRDTWMGGGKDKLIEMDESSGETKLLKIDKPKTKKK